MVDIDHLVQQSAAAMPLFTVSTAATCYYNYHYHYFFTLGSI